MTGDTSTNAQGEGAGRSDGLGWRWERTYPPEAGTVRRCRMEAADALRGAGVRAGTIADALLVLSELVGNAVRHAATEFTVSAAVAAGVLRVEVVDRDPRPPAQQGLDAQSVGGRGLHIVGGLTTDWGWELVGDGSGATGKKVWAEFASGTSGT